MNELKVNAAIKAFRASKRTAEDEDILYCALEDASGSSEYAMESVQLEVELAGEEE